MTEFIKGKCLHCGKPFKRAKPTNKNTTPKFCSAKCAGKHMWVGKKTVKVLTVKCETCGKQFKRAVAPSQKQPKYCSRKCHAAAQKKSVAQQFWCLHCNKQFVRKYVSKDHLPIFCGTKCKTLFVREAIDKALVERDKKAKR